MKDIKIRELMNRNVVTSGMDADPLEVATSMRNNRYSCIIVAEDDVPIGIVTERDIVRVFVDHYCDESKREFLMQDVVTTPVITVSEHTSLFDAIVLIESRKIRHLPVVNKEGRLSGIVTYSDLVHNHQRFMDEHIDIIEKEVKERTRDLTEANDKLHALSMEDYLLKIGNRRAMEVDLKYTHHATLRYKRSYSVALIDVDHFKKYNDRYGHEGGDKVLLEIVNYVKGTIRKSDRIYRYGGEEFLLLMQETLENGAYTLLQRLLTGIEALDIRHEDCPMGQVTVSAGIACVDGEKSPVNTWNVLISKADEALYQAKENGRNMCVVSGRHYYDQSKSVREKKSAA